MTNTLPDSRLTGIADILSSIQKMHTPRDAREWAIQSVLDAAWHLCMGISPAWHLSEARRYMAEADVFRDGWSDVPGPLKAKMADALEYLVPYLWEQEQWARGDIQDEDSPEKKEEARKTYREYRDRIENIEAMIAMARRPLVSKAFVLWSLWGVGSAAFLGLLLVAGR